MCLGKGKALGYWSALLASWTDPWNRCILSLCWTCYVCLFVTTVDILEQRYHGVSNLMRFSCCWCDCRFRWLFCDVFLWMSHTIEQSIKDGCIAWMAWMFFFLLEESCLAAFQLEMISYFVVSCLALFVEFAVAFPRFRWVIITKENIRIVWHILCSRVSIFEEWSHFSLRSMCDGGTVNGANFEYELKQ